MSAQSVADFAIELLQALPQLVNAGVNIATQVSQGVDLLQGMSREDRGPTQQEYEALRDLNRRAHEEVQRIAAQRQAESGGG